MQFKTLIKYEEKGLLYKQTHPSLPLTIWNYTDKVQYENLWDDITSSCRGLVTDNQGKIVARPFKKFFNLSEGRTNITSDYTLFEKLDGSLGILFFYVNQWIFASRGSFTSDQAIRGKELLDKNCNYEFLDKNNTYCFEIIYRENKIVVDYGNFEGVILTGVFNTETGQEDLFLDKWDLDTVNSLHLNDYFSLDNLHFSIKDNEEGYVVRFSNGERCKIKGAEYLRLHKLMSEMSTTAIWECLMNGDSIINFLKDIPDEFYNAIKEYEQKLNGLYQFWMNHFTLTYMKYMEIEDRKNFAISVKDEVGKNILFLMKDGKNTSKSIWKLIKPKYERIC